MQKATLVHNSSLQLLIKRICDKVVFKAVHCIYYMVMDLNATFLLVLWKLGSSHDK